MKHVIFFENSVKLADYLSIPEGSKQLLHVINWSELKDLVFQEEFSGEVICVGESPLAQNQLKILGQKFPNKKIIFVGSIEEQQVAELVTSGGLDLFFRPLVTLKEIEEKIEALSLAETGTMVVGLPSLDDGLEIENSSREEQSDEQSKKTVTELSEKDNIPDLAKELAGIDGSIMGVDHTLTNLNNPNQETGTFNIDTNEIQLDSADISRILQSEVLLREMSESPADSNPQVSKTPLPELSVQENSKAPALSVAQADVEDFSDEESSVVIKSHSANKKAAPKAESSHYEGLESVEQEVVQSVRLLHRDQEKLLSRNELLEEENRILKSKLISLEELAHSASTQSVQKTLENDESRIKISVIKRRYNERIKRLEELLTMSKQQIYFFKEKSKNLQSKNSELSKKKIVENTQVRAKEQELEQKLELLRLDVSDQIRNRENKIMQLKRQVDLLSFDIRESYEKQNELIETIEQLETKIFKFRSLLGDSLDELGQEVLLREVKAKI
jgi:hypothetical protein